MPDKMTILRQLEAGEITANEAMALMSQTRPQEPTEPKQPQTWQPNSNTPPPLPHDFRNDHTFQEDHDFRNDHGPHHQPSWAEGIFGWVGELVEDITDGLKDIDIDLDFTGFGGGHTRNVVFASKPVSQSLNLLELHGKNDKIEIQSHDGDVVHIQCEYTAKRPEDTVHFSDNGGNVSLMFDDKTMRSVKILCRVPRVHINELYAETKNDSISVVNIAGGNINLVTKNDPIHLEAINCKTLSARTKNDNIKARAISADSITFATTNSKITVDDIHAGEVCLTTTNAGIKTFAINATHIKLQTTNAGLKLDDALVCDGSLFWEGERTLEAFTTNGGIKFRVPHGAELCLEASTSMGRVQCGIPLYNVLDSKSYLKGESIGYPRLGAGFQLSLGLAILLSRLSNIKTPRFGKAAESGCFYCITHSIAISAQRHKRLG